LYKSLYWSQIGAKSDQKHTKSAELIKIEGNRIVCQLALLKCRLVHPILGSDFALLMCFQAFSKSLFICFSLCNLFLV